MEQKEKKNTKIYNKRAQSNVWLSYSNHIHISLQVEYFAKFRQKKNVQNDRKEHNYTGEIKTDKSVEKTI